ncbi:MAG TPA: EAL domain-containing response regulator [Stellaceae bacterium]|jgi:EAL domain-containing protein (putative c-di-GMP-specific phosphodiesterase class I)|nr:EAL domain-containing response regulator [Stellaceae bacterium]
MADDLFGDRLLMIDDEPALGNIVKRVAQSSGFEVVFTQDPSLFINTARLWRPTVILLDLKMPRTDGIQLLRTLASDKCSARVIVTSGADAKVLESAMALGRERGLLMDEAMQKPIRVEALRDRLFGFKRVSKLQLSADLTKAIATNQLFLEYQPKLNGSTRLITSAEALVRWQHPTQGVIPPDQFIALAEEIGIINRLTDWVMAAAAAQAARWRAADHPIEVAVNISARDIEDIDLPDRMEEHCLAAGIDPEFMTLELTETGAMREAVQMMDVLTRLRIKGFKLSIDDFGTGYSSLVQLQKMPFSEIKIDKSFVMEMMTNDSCRVIVEIILDLARKLGLSSVAEGVESEAALNALIEMGCNTAQGYHLSRPIAASGVTDVRSEFEAARKKVAA